MNDYYKILKVPTDASEFDIKKQYRKLSLQYHPDKNGGDDEKFKEINEAYGTLGDGQKKQEYDFQRQFQSDTANFSPGAGLDGLLNLFLNPGRGAGRSMRPPPMQGFPGATKVHFFSGNLDEELPNFMNMGNPTPDPIEHKVVITMKQAYFGCNVPIEIKRTITKTHNKYTEKETIYIDIPQGIDNNEKIVLKEQGNVTNDQCSNIHVFVSINNETKFLRNGLDFIYEKNISFKESICGFSFVIQYIDDREFKLNSKPGDIVLHTQEKTIPKLGICRNEQTGNLIIRFKIIPPEPLTKEQIQSISKII